MALTTAFTELLGVRHPIALAPMGGSAGGALAAAWPPAYTARTLGHPHLDRRRGREAELAADPHARQAYDDDVARGLIPALPIWAGEAIDLITDLPHAAD